jgi:hypothetical protein
MEEETRLMHSSLLPPPRFGQGTWLVRATVYGIFRTTGEEAPLKSEIGRCTTFEFFCR